MPSKANTKESLEKKQVIKIVYLRENDILAISLIRIAYRKEVY